MLQSQISNKNSYYKLNEKKERRKKYRSERKTQDPHIRWKNIRNKNKNKIIILFKQTNKQKSIFGFILIILFLLIRLLNKCDGEKKKKKIK